MRLTNILFLHLLLVCELIAQINNEVVLKIIEETRIKYAPDKRTAIFDIQYSLDSNSIYLSGETDLPEAKRELLSRFENKKIIDDIELLPSKDLSENIYGVVNLSVANVRTKPEHTAELATQVLLGSKLKILKRSGGWYQVQCEDDYIGWIDDDGFVLMDFQKFKLWNESPKIIVTAPFAFSYFENKAEAEPVSDIVVGDLLKFISQSNEFVKVEYPDGRISYVLQSQVQDYEDWLNSRVQTFESILHTARMMMGIPYLWGGTSIKGLDCSGFTKTVFMLNGVMLPRDASQQVYVGEHVDTKSGFDNLLPGDLLFFGKTDRDSGKERITHVAIYLGNLEFIHASGRVRINSLDKTKTNFAENRLKTFIKAKRILGSLNKNGVKLLKNFNNTLEHK